MIEVTISRLSVIIILSSIEIDCKDLSATFIKLGNFTGWEKSADVDVITFQLKVTNIDEIIFFSNYVGLANPRAQSTVYLTTDLKLRSFAEKYINFTEQYDMLSNRYLG